MSLLQTLASYVGECRENAFKALFPVVASFRRGIAYYSTSGYTGVSDSFAYGMPLTLVNAKAYPRVKTYVYFAEFAVGNEATASIICMVTSGINGFICSERTAEDVRTSSFLEARAILDIGRQGLFILVLCNGANLLGINSSLIKTGYCRSSHTMCGIHLRKASAFFDILGISWAIIYFPRGSFLYQQVPDLPKFINGV